MQVKVILTDADNKLYDGVVQIGNHAVKSENGEALFHHIEVGAQTLRYLVLGYRGYSQHVEITHDNQVITLFVRGNNNE